MGFAIAIALVYWTDILWLIFPGDAGAPSAIYRLTMLCIYAVVGLLLLRQPGDILQLLRLTPALTMLLALPLVSGLWSIAPTETMNRAVALVGSCTFGLYLVARMPGVQFIVVIASASTLAALLSATMIVAVPSIGLMPDGEYLGAWRGAYSHKNAFGFMTSFGTVICLIGWRAVRTQLRWIFALGFALNLLLLTGSRSLTGQISVLASIVIFLSAAWFIRAVYANAFAVGASVALLSFVTVSLFSMDDVSNLLATFGKDLTLSARMPLWELIIPFVKERPWFGYGYDAFWVDGHYAVDIITLRMRFNPSYSHNGILELWLNLGLIGVCLFVVAFAQLLARACALLLQTPQNPIYLMSIVYSFLLVIGNISEATLMQRNSMSWIVFVVLALLLARDRQRSTVDGAARVPVAARLPRAGKLRVQ
jgi:exopolysaccharide production protein ExoQ